MYIPRSFAEQDLPTLFAFIEAHPLAALVTGAKADLVATHLPLLLDRESGPNGTLIGHLARANPQSRWLMKKSRPALVIFTGPGAYITPTSYASKAETGRVVPTWDYVAVHAWGTLRFQDDPRVLRGHLEMLTRRHELPRQEPWHVSDAPDEFIGQQMKAIVGVTIQIDRLEGNWKMSQNRSDADIDGVIHALKESPAPQDQAVAAIVAERRPKR